ncbi:MAG: TonB-dependent receptor plug domain-containing protein [Bacteroides sp.]|nr:TonB-dependent receptor plug domain-containing protein [Bacteroides sp.]
MKKEVNIGVLSVATALSFSGFETAVAQNEVPVQMKEYELEEVEITGSRAPLSLDEAARMVTVLSRQEIEAAPVQSVNDLLKYAVGVDVRQRGDMGIQTDITIRGGTFEQITILLNGININNPQTGHNTADFPVDIHDIERIEILEGPASRVYGTSAFTGAINIITRTVQENNLSLHISGGQHGLFTGGASLGYRKKSVTTWVSGRYSRSDGYIRSSDFETQQGYYQGTYTHPDVDVSWQLGFTNRDFGANTFYSAAFPDQFEHLRRYIISVRAETKGKVRFRPSVYWIRNEDRFELVKGVDSNHPYNYHLGHVYGINLNAYFHTRAGKTSFGAEMRSEGVRSTSLGKELYEPVNVPGSDYLYTKGADRTNISFYGEQIFCSPVSLLP